jgi:hypothetical protein
MYYIACLVQDCSRGYTVNINTRSLGVCLKRQVCFRKDSRLMGGNMYIGIGVVLVWGTMGGSTPPVFFVPKNCLVNQEYVLLG